MGGAAAGAGAGASAGTRASTGGAAGSMAAAGAGGSSQKGGGAGTTPVGTGGTAGAQTLPDAGTPMAPADAAAGTIPVVVAAGWSGLRVGSRDLGKTWVGRTVSTNTVNAEGQLLRAVTFGEGLFVAVGIDRFYSADGVTWKKGNATSGAWLSGIAYGHGMFVGAGNGGIVERSLDGINWEKVANPSKEHLRAVAFDGQRFATSGNETIVYVSTDAVAWTVLPGVGAYEITYCDGALRDQKACAIQGVQRFGMWWRCGGPHVDVSVDGKTDWKVVYNDKDGNRFVDSFRSLAFGHVPM